MSCRHISGSVAHTYPGHCPRNEAECCWQAKTPQNVQERALFLNQYLHSLPNPWDSHLLGNESSVKTILLLSVLFIQSQGSANSVPQQCFKLPGYFCNVLAASTASSPAWPTYSCPVRGRRLPAPSAAFTHCWPPATGVNSKQIKTSHFSHNCKQEEWGGWGRKGIQTGMKMDIFQLKTKELSFKTRF